jgi:signal transduction histidine kinase
VRKKEKEAMRALDPKERRRFRDSDTLTIEDRRPVGNLPEPVDVPEFRPIHPSWSRLDHLYRIAKLLAEFESAEKPLESTLAIVSDTLPLRSAVVIEEIGNRADLRVWASEDARQQGLGPAKAHAATLYSYFSGATWTTEARPGVDLDEFVPWQQSRAAKVIVIPLVVDHLPVFGAIQLECVSRCNEADVAFANAVANQLAIALDRYKVRQREEAARAAAQAGERRMQFLAEASKLLAVSLDYRSACEHVARLATHHIADVCSIDIVEADESLRRIAVSSPELHDEISADDVVRPIEDRISNVLRTGEPVVYPKVQTPRQDSGGENVEEKVGGIPGTLPESYVCVPLRFTSAARGALTIVRVRPQQSYTVTDLVLLQDLAGRVTAAFENAQLYAHALQASRSRDDVLAIVSHDLKGPLSLVLGFVEVFLRKSAPTEPLICDRKQVEAIRRSAKQMNRLINDLLDTASIEASQLRVTRDFCPIGPLISEAIEFAESLRQDTWFVLETEVAADLPPVFVDRHRILQVLTNLIGNAAKFTPPDGTITVRAIKVDEGVQCSVKDCGPGIQADDIPHLFDRFWQARNTAQHGRGLGLFIVKGIVESHGGTIWVESQKGRGSEFFFTLPTSRENR